MGLAKIYACTKFEVSSFTRSKDTAHVPVKWLDARGGVPKLTPSFLLDPTKFGVTVVEWSMLNANVLDFRYVFALSNYGANCLRLSMKNGANFGFFGPVLCRGHFEKIGIAKVMLNTKPRRVGKFRGCRFSTSEKVWREKKETAAKYNGSLALAIARAGDRNNNNNNNNNNIVM